MRARRRRTEHRSLPPDYASSVNEKARQPLRLPTGLGAWQPTATSEMTARCPLFYRRGSAFIRRGKHLEETLAVHDAAHRGQQFQDYYDSDWNLVRRRYSDGTVLRVVDE